jgi:hypothetical protein
MPIVYNRRCNVCKTIEHGDATLLRRIYNSAKFKTDGEPMLRIAQDYEGQFNYTSLTQHVRKHQFITERDLKKATIDKINKQGANSAVLHAVNHGQVRGLVMDRGYKGIKSGKIKLKAADVLKAAKDQADVEFKQKDQGLQLMELMMKFQSGELKAGDENGELGGADAPRQVDSASTYTL